MNNLNRRTQETECAKSAPPTSKSGQPAPWRALQVYAGSEHRVFQQLAQRGLQVFLPCYTEIRQWSDRVKRFQVPFFAGYLFARISQPEAALALRTPNVIQIVGGADHPDSVIPDCEIDVLHRIVASDTPVARCERLLTGEPVRIVSGPLRNLEGVVISDEKGSRLMISLDLLQRAIEIRVDRDSVLPLRTQSQAVINWVEWKEHQAA